MRTKDQSKRDAIRKATIHEVVHAGLHVCSMPRIARRAGVSVGTIYVYFEDKTTLFTQLFDELRKEIDDALKQAVPELNDHALREVWFALLAYLATHQEEFRFIEIMKSAQVIPDQGASEHPASHTIRALEHALASGRLRPELTMTQLSMLLFAPLRMLALKPEGSWQHEDASQIYAALERGIQTSLT